MMKHISLKNRNSKIQSNKSLIVELLRKVQRLKCDKIKPHLKQLCLITNRKFHTTYGFLDKGIVAILQHYGNGTSLSMKYIQAEAEKRAQAKRRGGAKTQTSRRTSSKINKEEEERRKLALLGESPSLNGSKSARFKKPTKKHRNSMEALPIYARTPRNKMGK
jgi:hypothetical protein